MAAADDALQAVGPQIGMPVSVACVSKNGIRSFWRQPPSSRRRLLSFGRNRRNRRNRPFEVGENLSDAYFSGWPLSLFLFLVSSFEYRIAVVDDSIFRVWRWGYCRIDGFGKTGKRVESAVKMCLGRPVALSRIKASRKNGR